MRPPLTGAPTPIGTPIVTVSLTIPRWEKIGLDYDFNTWDANSDGYIDSGEFYDGVYSTYDANQDGHWNYDEWKKAGEDKRFNFS